MMNDIPYPRNSTSILQKYFSISLQNPYIFPGTFVDNILYYFDNKNISIRKIIEDFKLSHLQNNIFSFELLRIYQEEKNRKYL